MRLKSILTTLVMLLTISGHAMAGDFYSPEIEVMAPPAKTYTIIITGNGVIGRDGPAGYDTGVRFSKGQKLTCYGLDGTWYKVKYGDGVRWVSSQYAKPYTATTKTATKKATPTYTNYVVITGNSVIGRTSPAGKDSGIRLNKGTRLPYLGYQGSWHKVNYKGKVLWVSNEFSYVE